MVEETILGNLRRDLKIGDEEDNYISFSEAYANISLFPVERRKESRETFKAVALSNGLTSLEVSDAVSQIDLSEAERNSTNIVALAQRMAEKFTAAKAAGFKTAEDLKDLVTAMQSLAAPPGEDVKVFRSAQRKLVQALRVRYADWK